MTGLVKGFEVTGNAYLLLEAQRMAAVGRAIESLGKTFQRAAADFPDDEQIAYAIDEKTFPLFWALMENYSPNSSEFVYNFTDSERYAEISDIFHVQFLKRLGEFSEKPGDTGSFGDMPSPEH